MIKETISYEDYDGKQKVEILRFDISHDDLMSNMDLEDEFRKVEEIVGGEPRDLTRPEIQFILNLVKRMMKLGYGELIEKNGRQIHRKTDEIWQDFTGTKAYDTFLMSLFNNPEKAWLFIMSLFPKELLESAKAKMSENGQGELLKALETPVDRVEVKATELTDAQKELIAKVDRNPSAATHEELVEAMKLKSRL